MTWAESYEPVGGKATHTYDDGPLAGKAAVVQNGNVTTIGAWSESLVKEVLAGLLEELGIPTSDRRKGYAWLAAERSRPG